MSEEQKVMPNGQSTSEDVQDVSGSRLASQLVIFPLAIVLVGVGVYLMLGMLTVEEKTAQDYLNTIRTGGINSRWQAAFDMVKALAKEQKEGQVSPRFAQELIRVYEASEHDDPRVRRFLIRAMMMVPDPAIVPVLIEALDGPDEDTRIYAILSLGAQKDNRAIDPLIRMAKWDDAGIRKTAVYALGQFRDDRATGLLEWALQDPAPDVRWNAAVQLAHQGNGKGSEVLGEMLNRSFLESVDGMNESHREKAMIQAIRAVGLLKVEMLVSTLETLRNSDSNMKVRQAAIEVLKAWKK
ncbi:MAG: HEAT repeat domain-containing protein [bacterium]|nr:HEAT repeat domain-containing protein [bacterium]